MGASDHLRAILLVSARTSRCLKNKSFPRSVSSDRVHSGRITLCLAKSERANSLYQCWYLIPSEKAIPREDMLEEAVLFFVCVFFLSTTLSTTLPYGGNFLFFRFDIYFWKIFTDVAVDDENFIGDFAIKFSINFPSMTCSRKPSYYLSFFLVPSTLSYGCNKKKTFYFW